MSIKYFIREAFRNLFGAKRLNVIALGATSMSLMALGLVLVLNAGIYGLAEFVEQKVEVVVFLSDQTGSDAAAGLLRKVQDHPQVVSAAYVSKAEALQEFSADPALKDFVAILGSNPLPASIRIRLLEMTPENVARFADWLKGQEGVADASYGGGDTDRLLKVLQFVRAAVLVLTASLVLAAVVIISNIISLMVFSKQEQIKIMRMIGATRGFIRGPFLIWGLIQGTLAGLLASALLAGIGVLLQQYVLVELGIDLCTLLPADALRQALLGMAGLVGVGSLLGFTGSLVAVGRELGA